MAQNSFRQILQKQMKQTLERPVYCRFCGKNVKEPSSNSPGGSEGNWRRYLDWEVENHAHVICANKRARSK